jgi:integrase
LKRKVDCMTRHQRGYVFEAHGAFHVRYYATVDGVRKQLSHRLCTKDRNTGHGSPSAKAVQLLCEDFMRTINTDVPAPTALTITQFWDKTYLPFITANLKHSTVCGYKNLWKQHLKEHFGVGKLREYKTPMMSLFLTNLAKTLRPRTLNTIKFLASGLFAHAVATGEAESNPIRDAQVLGKTLEHGATGAYSLEEIENIISALVDHVDCQLIMALAFFLGLRKGEIAGLQWSDIDGDYIHVRRSIVRGVVDTPKTKKSVRSIPIIAPVQIPLLLWKKQRGDGVWLFSERDLGQYGKHVIIPTLKKAKLQWKGFHAGRRGLGTALRALTGNSNAGRDMLGHSTTQVTEAHYEAAMPEEVLKGMKLLEAKAKENTNDN